MSTTPIGISQAAYEAACPKGIPWDRLHPNVQAKWDAAAIAAVRQHFSLIGQRGGRRKTKAKLETGRILMGLINEGKDD